MATNFGARVRRESAAAQSRHHVTVHIPVPHQESGAQPERPKLQLMLRQQVWYVSSTHLGQSVMSPQGKYGVNMYDATTQT
jgi:hypothetical protein